LTSSDRALYFFFFSFLHDFLQLSPWSASFFYFSSSSISSQFSSSSLLSRAARAAFFFFFFFSSSSKQREEPAGKDVGQVVIMAAAASWAIGSSERRRGAENDARPRNGIDAELTTELGCWRRQRARFRWVQLLGSMSSDGWRGGNGFRWKLKVQRRWV
jgi:hypothetical protein